MKREVIQMKLIVTGTSDEGAFITEHKGNPLNVMMDIAKQHSYNQFDGELMDEEERKEAASLTFDQMKEVIMECNGDGCDYITAIIEIEGDYKIHDLES